ncbi:MAG: LuxR C-terminal-related transcriptional regulator [Dermatophilaceae bacterium]
MVGEGTVKTHVSNALGKTGCRSRVHLVALA